MYPFERELYTEMLVDYLKAQEEANKRNNNG